MTEPQPIFRQSLEIPAAVRLLAGFLLKLHKPWGLSFLSFLFRSPVKHKIPKRELKMESETKQYFLMVPSIKKEIRVYEYGNIDLPRILLVHGWSGRGTQLCKIAEALVEKGYCTVSFDAPAHGKNKDRTTDMTEFIESILELDRAYYSFVGGIGHSLGGMSLLNSVKMGLKMPKLVTIGSADKVSEILEDFMVKMGQAGTIASDLKLHLEKRYGLKMDRFSSSFEAERVKTPVLIIHDTEDKDVPYSCAEQLAGSLPNANVITTSGLGHKRILGNEKVIDTIITFLEGSK